MAQASPEQRSTAEKFSVGITEGAFLGSPIIAIPFVAIMSLGLGTINFVFGGRPFEACLPSFTTRGCRNWSKHSWEQL